MLCGLDIFVDNKNNYHQFTRYVVDYLKKDAFIYTTKLTSEIIYFVQNSTSFNISHTTNFKLMIV